MSSLLNNFLRLSPTSKMCLGDGLLLEEFCPATSSYFRNFARQRALTRGILLGDKFPLHELFLNDELFPKEFSSASRPPTCNISSATSSYLQHFIQRRALSQQRRALLLATATSSFPRNFPQRCNISAATSSFPTATRPPTCNKKIFIDDAPSYPQVFSTTLSLPRNFSGDKLPPKQYFLGDAPTRKISQQSYSPFFSSRPALFLEPTFLNNELPNFRRRACSIKQFFSSMKSFTMLSCHPTNVYNIPYGYR